MRSFFNHAMPKEGSLKFSLLNRRDSNFESPERVKKAKHRECRWPT